MMLTEDSFANIKSIIDECLNNEKYKIGREEARNETWNYIGDCGKRAVDFIIKKYNELQINYK